MEQQLEQLQNKVDDLETTIDVMNEFITSRISDIEAKIEAPVMNSTPISSEDSDEDSDAHHVQIPVNMKDVSTEWRGKLTNFTSPIKSGEKLTAAQLAFFNFFVEGNKEKNGATSAALAEALVTAGQKNRFWYHGWKPEGTKDLTAYILEKLKTWRRREITHKVGEEMSSLVAAKKQKKK